MANKKKKTVKPHREFTRRQLSQWQRQRRRQRIIFSAGIFVIAVVVLIVAAGWLTSEYLPRHQVAIRVNDTEFDMEYYLDMLRISGEGQPVEFLWSLAAGAVTDIERNELIRQEALTLGISVSDDDVKEKLEGSDIKLNDAVLDWVRSRILIDRLHNEYFESRVPDSAGQVHIMAMSLESESRAAEVRAELQNSGNFTALAEEFSLSVYTGDNKGDLGWHPEDILAVLLGSSVPGEYAFSSEVGILSQPRYDGEISKSVGYWIIRVLEREEDAEEALVQAILLGSEEEADDVIEKLVLGESWATLAQELSQFEKSRKQDGEFGLVSRGEISPAFSEFVFNTEIVPGIVSMPIRDEAVVTKGGYWLIKVIDRDDDRQLESDDRDYLMAKAFNDWVSLLWADPGNEVDDSYLNDEVKAWAVERMGKG